jgi:hypothetical protein
VRLLARRAAAAKVTTAGRRELKRRGLLPPASARDVATRELARGNWRPH